MKFNLTLILILCIVVLIALLKYVMGFIQSTNLLLSAGVLIVLLILLAGYTIVLQFIYKDREEE